MSCVIYIFVVCLFAIGGGIVVKLITPKSLVQTRVNIISKYYIHYSAICQEIMCYMTDQIVIVIFSGITCNFLFSILN